MPFGYLSVLLSYLCINKDARIFVESNLKGQTLQQLLDAVEEFLHYHRQIEDEILQNEEVDSRANFISRLQGVVILLKQDKG